MKGYRGFTYIEILIALAILAICFVPLIRMFSTSIREGVAYSDLTTAINLAREGMERVKNLSLTEAQLANQGEVWYPPLDEPPLTMNRTEWRIRRSIVKGTDPLEVWIAVFRVEDMSKPVVELVTLIEDF